MSAIAIDVWWIDKMECFWCVITRNHIKRIPILNRYIIKSTTEVFCKVIFCIG